MKKIVLFGAFDRYNYGDNLMPIIFQKYIDKYRPAVNSSHEIVYAAISQADLSHYQCVNPKKINALIGELEKGSAVIVIGGEVLCSSNADLYLHMQNSAFTHNLALTAKKHITKLYNLFTKCVYSTRWDYPFIVDKACLPSGIKVIYNTIGGKVNPNNKPLYQKITQRIKSADYFSVRDSRTLEQLKDTCETHLAPDSVFILPDVIDDAFLTEKVRPAILALASQPKKYVVQAAPAKTDSTISTLTAQIATLAKQSDEQVILLPIGYASGHDDRALMAEIHQLLPADTVLFDDLNVWEILFVIKSAKAFMGTSLHGVITAMAYGIPHFGLNPNIGKLDAFLSEWSIAPYNHCYSVEKIEELADTIKPEHRAALQNNALRIISLVKENNERILNTIINN